MADGPGLFSIGAVARMLGVSQATIRSWEDRYAVVIAGRSDSGRRIYSRAQLDQLQFVKAQLDGGLSAADAHRLLAEREAGGAPDTARRQQDDPARPPILLAESNRHSAELSETLLRTEGYDLEIVLSAEEAEARAAELDPALSIVELMISGGVGRQLCLRLKALSSAPVLAVASLDLREQALAAGADAFLRKPLDPSELIATISGLLARQGLARQGLARQGLARHGLVSATLGASATPGTVR